MIVNDNFFRVNYLDSERYLKMTCDCKLFSMRIFSFVVKPIYSIEIIMHVIPTNDFDHIIPVFILGFTMDFINSYSLKFRHEAFHHGSYYSNLSLYALPP